MHKAPADCFRRYALLGFIAGVFVGLFLYLYDFRWSDMEKAGWLHAAVVVPIVMGLFFSHMGLAAGAIFGATCSRVKQGEKMGRD